MKKKQYVTIKGTKDGLTLHLDDNCSYEELIQELNVKLSENSSYSPDGRPLISVKVQVGNRYLSNVQQEELLHLIHQKKNFMVESIYSNVVTRADAEKMKEQNEIVSAARIVRSGQILEASGDLLLIGDVNPGGTVLAGGNIFILGTLRGIAHAGCTGNKKAVIAASVMKPSQLRIDDCIHTTLDQYPEQVKNEMECAFIDENNEIAIDRLQVLMHLRPSLTRLEGGY
ncbi:septum site-determining protein MinC [Bacillus sp. 03113]|uniref:septum site-determining protein MinC n=1 Tax=Bacillus sp. 03113 TaxID=2578211 RepID=UPI0011429747|nr:septum site-determining protein MinC [Bacillus sp. 03113]